MSLPFNLHPFHTTFTPFAFCLPPSSPSASTQPPPPFLQPFASLLHSHQHQLNCHLPLFSLLPPTFTPININSTATSLCSSPASHLHRSTPPSLSSLFTPPQLPNLTHSTHHQLSVRRTMLPTPSALATFCDAHPSSSDVITPIISSPQSLVAHTLIANLV